MIDIVRINWYGRQTVYKEWISNELITNKLYYIHNGNCTYFDGDKEVKLEKGYLYLIPSMAPFKPYSDESDPLDHSFIDFHFTPPIVSPDIYKLNPEIDPLTKATTEFFLKLAGRTVNTTFYQNNFNDDTMQVLIPAIKLLIKRFISAYNPVIPKDTLAISVMRDLIENIGNEVTINDLAKKYYTSADVIIRTFKKNYNTTPYAYLKELRIKTARKLIDSGEKLSDVAHATNYADTSSLSHALKNSSTNE